MKLWVTLHLPKDLRGLELADGASDIWAIHIPTGGPWYGEPGILEYLTLAAPWTTLESHLIWVMQNHWIWATGKVPAFEILRS